MKYLGKGAERDAQGAKRKSWTSRWVTHVPDGEEDERRAQHQRQHVAKSSESEGHGWQTPIPQHTKKRPGRPPLLQGRAPSHRGQQAAGSARAPPGQQLRDPAGRGDALGAVANRSADPARPPRQEKVQRRSLA